MSPYVHHIPGRLRFRTPALKRNPQAAEAVRGRLTALPGVRSAEVNSLTGSVTVLYDAASGASDALLSALHESAGLPGREPATRSGRAVRRAVSPLSEPASGRGRRNVAAAMIRTLALFAIEKAVERSVLLLVAKLL